MIFLCSSKIPELLLIEFRKTGRQYLVLEIYSSACNNGGSLDFEIGYCSLAIDVVGKNDAMWYGTGHFCVLNYSKGPATYICIYLLPLEHYKI